MAADTDIKVCNAALARAGSAVISTFTDNKGQRVLAIYEPMRDAALTAALWRFNSAKIALTRLGAAPPTRWAYAYQLPSDRLDMPLAIYDGADAGWPESEYEYEGDKLLTDLEQPYALRQYRPETPALWSPLFTDFFTTLLAADFALALNEDRSRWQTFRQAAYGPAMDPLRAEGLFGIAMAREAAATPPQEGLPDGGPLARARLGG